MTRTLLAIGAIAVCSTDLYGALAEESTGRLCLAAAPVPTPGPRSLGNPTGDLPDVTYSVRIDRLAAVKLSRTKGTWVPGLSLNERHSTVILADQKPIESFYFAFDSASPTELCLFMAPLYETWRLSPLRHTGPWCSCGPLDPGDTPQPPPARLDAWAERFVNTDFALTSQLPSLPATILLFLKERCREELAAPGQAFNRTDFVDDRLPMRRLILAGKTASLAFVWYEHGARGFHEHLLLFDLSGSEATLVYHVRPTASSLAELKSRIGELAWRNEVNSTDEF